MCPSQRPLTDHFVDNSSNVPDNTEIQPSPHLGSRKGHKNKSRKVSEAPWTAGCFWDTLPVSRQKCLFCQLFNHKHRRSPRTPAGRPLLLPLGVRGRPEGFAKDVVKLCALLFPEHCHGLRRQFQRRQDTERSNTKS